MFGCGVEQWCFVFYVGVVVQFGGGVLGFGDLGLVIVFDYFQVYQFVGFLGEFVEYWLDQVDYFVGSEEVEVQCGQVGVEVVVVGVIVLVYVVELDQFGEYVVCGVFGDIQVVCQLLQGQVMGIVGEEFE